MTTTPDHPYTNMTDVRNFEGQQPCPSCGDQMEGVGWRCKCGEGMECVRAACWQGPYGHCRACTTEEVVDAVIERIASELERIADGSVTVAFTMNLWEWTVLLAERVRAGELTSPLPKDHPY